MDEMTFTETQKALATGLFAIGAIKFGAFRLKLHETNPSAPLSPIYIDLRLLRSSPDVMDLATDALGEIATSLRYDRLADIPIGSSPIVAILSHKVRKPLITPRPAKTHGTGGEISGSYSQGETILLVDDLISKADSKFEAIRILEAAGLRVKDVLVIVDREQGGARQLAEAGYILHAVMKVSDLLKFYLTSGMIDEARYSECISYLSSS
ncbi:MAG: hypothetical protein Q7O66_14795 [Dehalococcoidia bacterium]|nr:hypothetical protein [Dehalococcoidia bacterium]